MTRNEILSLTNLNDGGSFTNVLNELEWCNFIRLQPAYGRTKKDTLYRLSDEYSLFYIRFINKQKTINWTLLGQSQKWKSWSGYAFENICLKHMLQLKKALGIGGCCSMKGPGKMFHGVQTAFCNNSVSRDYLHSAKIIVLFNYL